MPLYEYVCQECHQACELLVRGTEPARCPACRSLRLEKMLSVPAAHSGGTSDLPVCDPSPGPCGRPGCGSGGCAF